jgi:hypothetical protein
MTYLPRHHHRTQEATNQQHILGVRARLFLEEEEKEGGLEYGLQEEEEKERKYYTQEERGGEGVLNNATHKMTGF